MLQAECALVADSWAVRSGHGSLDCQGRMQHKLVGLTHTGPELAGEYCTLRGTGETRFLSLRYLQQQLRCVCALLAGGRQPQRADVSEAPTPAAGPVGMAPASLVV